MINKHEEDTDDRNMRVSEIESLKRKVCHLTLQRDLLEGVAEPIKKETGVSLKNLTNKGKAILIDALKKEYEIKVLFVELKILPSSYFYKGKFNLIFN